jgi:hypothetical protein
MSDPIGLCPVCGADMYQGDCPQCRERDNDNEAVIDAEVVSADEWRGIEAQKTKDAAAARAQEDIKKIARGIRINQAISVIVHCDLVAPDGDGDFSMFKMLTMEPKKNPEEDVIRNAQELLLAKLDAVTKRVDEKEICDE